MVEEKGLEQGRIFYHHWVMRRSVRDLDDIFKCDLHQFQGSKNKDISEGKYTEMKICLRRFLWRVSTIESPNKGIYAAVIKGGKTEENR